MTQSGKSSPGPGFIALRPVLFRFGSHTFITIEQSVTYFFWDWETPLVLDGAQNWKLISHFLFNSLYRLLSLTDWVSLAVCESLVALGASPTRLSPMSTDLQLISSVMSGDWAWAGTGCTLHSCLTSRLLLTTDDTNTVLRTHTGRHRVSWQPLQLPDTKLENCQPWGVGLSGTNLTESNPPQSPRVLPPSNIVSDGWRSRI